MVARNDITNDFIKSRILSKEGRENHDNIFAKRRFMDWVMIEGVEVAAVQSDEVMSYSEFKNKLAEILEK